MTTRVVKTGKQKKETERIYCGRAWRNVPRSDENKPKAQQRWFFNGSLDSNSPTIEIGPGTRFQLWPNQKREGKNDADLRFSIIVENEEKK